MPYWKKKQPEFDKMDTLIQEVPGIRPAQIAQRLGVSRSTVMRRLPSMEQAGYLYSEDDRGGLHPFRRKRR